MILVPTYDSIGPMSQYILLLIRLTQGIAVGGQSPGCQVIAMRSCKVRNRGLRGSMCHAAACTGFLLANLVAVGVRRINGSWRISFLLSYILIIPMLVFLKEKSKLSDTHTKDIKKWEKKVIEDDNLMVPQPSFNWDEGTTSYVEAIDSSSSNGSSNCDSYGAHVQWQRRQQKRYIGKRLAANGAEIDDASNNRDTGKATLEESMGENGEAFANSAGSTPVTPKLAFMKVFEKGPSFHQLLSHIVATSVLSACFNLMVIFLPAYLSGPVDMISAEGASALNAIVLVYYITLTLTFGRISDMNPPRTKNIACGILAVISATPFLLLSIETRVMNLVIFCEFVYATFLAIATGPWISWQVEIWSYFPKVEYSGLAIGHNVANAVFGGTFPVIAMYMAKWKITHYCEIWNVSYLECNEIMSSSRIFPLKSAGLYIFVLGLCSLYALLFVCRHPHEYELTLRGGKKIFIYKPKIKVSGGLTKHATFKEHLVDMFESFNRTLNTSEKLSKTADMLTDTVEMGTNIGELAIKNIRNINACGPDPSAFEMEPDIYHQNGSGDRVRGRDTIERVYSRNTAPIHGQSSDSPESQEAMRRSKSNPNLEADSSRSKKKKMVLI